MKLHINILFSSLHSVSIIKSDMQETIIDLVLVDDIFDNLQKIKSFIKKFILSFIFNNIKSIIVNAGKASHYNEIQSVIMLDNILNMLINKNDKLKHVEYKMDNIVVINHTEHIIFKKLFCRYLDLLYSTANKINPETLSQEMLNLCAEFVEDKKFIFKDIIAEENTFPLIYNVGKGGEKRPRLLLCGLGVEKEQDFYKVNYKICLVGKGVTYDSGGYSIKPSTSMVDMSIDKSGSLLAFFVAIFNYVAYNIPCIFVSPVVQNLINEKSYLPGDIIISKMGVNVNVENTDAEGRIILADAMEYAVKYFKFKYCFTFATLTGAAVIAVGPHRTAYLTKDDELSEQISNLSSIYGEKAHRLPIDKYYTELIQKTTRNVKVINNITVIPRVAGTITAGAFVEYFYNNAHKHLKKEVIPSFCHFDIAALINLDYFDSLSYSYNLLFISQLCKKI